MKLLTKLNILKKNLIALNILIYTSKTKNITIKLLIQIKKHRKMTSSYSSIANSLVDIFQTNNETTACPGSIVAPSVPFH